MVSLADEETFIAFYLLFSRDNTATAGYIGTTKDPYQRMQDHVLNMRHPIIPRRSSSDLISWANKRKVQIHIAFLEVGYFKEQDQRPIEGAWIAAGKQAGFVLPGVERWGAMSSLHFVRSMSNILPHLEAFPTLTALVTSGMDSEATAIQVALSRALQTSS